jgi:hypothetical protein
VTDSEKRAAIDAAWSRYKHERDAIPNLPWDHFVREDSAAWERYKSAERSIIASK